MYIRGWKSGANTWNAAKREAFANDLTNPQLIAVTDDVNQAKGDKTPDLWKPPLSTSFRPPINIKMIILTSIQPATTAHTPRCGSRSRARTDFP